MKPLQSLAALHLAAIVESSDDAIVSKDLNGIVQSWNRAAERMFGYGPAEAIGRSITLIIPTDRLGEEEEVLARIRRGQAVDHFETVRVRKDGTLLHVSLTVSPIRDESGTIIGASKVARDISERRRAERSEADRVELQGRLSALVAASGILLASLDLSNVLPAVLGLATQLIPADASAIWRLDPASNVWQADASEGLSDVFTRPLDGTAAPQALPSFPAPVAAADVNDVPALAARRDVYAAEGIRSLLLVPLTIGGSPTGTLVLYYRTPRQFSFVEVQVASALGNLSATAIWTAELHEEQRRNRERQAFLAKAGATLTSSLDFHETLTALANLAVPDIADWCAVDIVDEQGRIARVAVAHADPVKAALVRSLEGRLPENPDSPYSLAHVIRTGEPAWLEHISDEVLAAAGYDEEHRRYIRELGLRSFICTPLVAHGRTLGAVTFTSAESGRRYTKADLPFAGAVANRAALAIEQARAFQDVREANRIKDEFLGTLSHELRTPLNAIMGYTRMLRSGLMQGDQLWRALEIIERNAGALNQIVGDVLDIARITSGKVCLAIETVDLRQVIDEAVATVLPAARAKGVRLHARTPDAAFVSGDPARLQQVVWNLLTNAVKFTDRDGSVDVRLERRDQQAELVVTDTGQGILPAFLPHVFERFRQADGRVSREHGGLGIGLAICRQLLEMHGGTITAESEGIGQGATFHVGLPLLAAVAAPQAEPEELRTKVPPIAAVAADTPSWAADALRALVVLVVDDDADSRSLLHALLGGAGARVLTASSGAAALDVLKDVLPDVMLVTSGFHMHLAKPVDPTELLASLSALARRVRKPLGQE